MLAPVEDEHRVGVTKAREGARERVGAPRVEGLGCEANDVGAACRAREVDMPRSVTELALDRSHRLEGEPALADSRRPGQRHEAMLPQELGHLGELRLAADERGRRRRQVAAPLWCHGDGRDRRVVSEDRLLEAPQLRAWLERQLLQEHLAGLLEHLERVRLASAAVEGKHQVPPQALAERALLQRSADGGHQVGVLAERESRLEVLLQRVELQRVQPRGLGRRPRGLRQTEQRRPAPEGERLGDRVRGAARIAGAERAARSREQLLELDGIDRRPVERVPVGGEPDRVLAQRPAQPGHMVLHGVSRRCGEIAAPQRLDQRVRRDDATRSQGQARHERLPLGARHVHRRPRDDHLERPQEPNLELSHTACPPLSRAVWHAGPGSASRVTRRPSAPAPSGLLASGAARPAA